MSLIDWLHLQSTEADLASATQALQGVAHRRTLLQGLVRTVLRSHPWDDRDDRVPLFDPTQRYAVGDFTLGHIALCTGTVTEEPDETL